MVRKADEMSVNRVKELYGGKGEIEVTHILKQDELKGKCKFCAKVKLAPGASIGLHRHDDEEEIYYITAGTGLVNDNGVEKTVTAGDVLLTAGGEEHSIENTGSDPLEFNAVILLYS